MIATKLQAVSSGHRIYGSRKLSHDERVDREEMRRRMRAKGVRQVHLANALGLTPEKVSKSLDAKGTRTFSDDEMRIVRQMLREDDEPIHAADHPALPLIGQVQAGTWSEAVQQSGATMPSPTPDPPRKAFALEVVGDSMNRLVAAGGRVIVDPDDRDLYPERYYVVLNGRGETTFKQFLADPARLVPCSDNPTHKPIPLGGGETFTIVGRVIWRASPM